MNKFPECSLRSCLWVNVGVDLSTSTCKFPPEEQEEDVEEKGCLECNDCFDFHLSTHA